MFWNLLLPLAQGGQTASLGSGMHVLWKLLITVGCVVVAYLAGRLLSARFRMPDYNWKITLITFTVLSGLAIVILGWPPKFGIDLYGGVNLVYEVDQTKVGGDGQSVDMDQLIGAVRLRVDPTGTKQILIRPYGQGDAVEIIVPRVSQAEVEELKRQIVDLGTLSFRITANQRDHQSEITQALELLPTQKVLRDSTGAEMATWVPVVQKEKTLEQLSGSNFVTRVVPTQTDKGEVDRMELLVMADDWDVNGEFLRQVTPGRDESGRPSVNFLFNGEGARRFNGLTSANIPDPDQFKRHLAIVLSGELYSAPELNEAISDRGEIAGEFTPEEQESLVAVLNAGSLPAALNKTPLREQQISPTLGQDTIYRGQIAMVVSTALVLVFVLIYYRFAGIIACVALLVNLVLTLAIMISINAAFTLPGLAGLVLTVGMAVDANVLIYERIREELARGAALRMAIRNGFSRATTTIVDANLTTLITAVVLYAIGTDQIKGFAVTLILGILMSMYSAIFCSRAVFEIGERTRSIKKLNMMRMFTSTNFDFLGKKSICISISLLLIVVGIGAVVVRGSGVLDIDFTGGSQAQILFSPSAGAVDTNLVRTEIEKWNKQVADAKAGNQLESMLGEDLTESLRAALRDRLMTEIKAEYTVEERKEMGDDSRIDAIAGEEADKRLPTEFQARLESLASLPDLSVSAVTYFDSEDHPPEFIVNTSNNVLRAVETILERIFEGKLETNSLTFEQTQPDLAANGAPSSIGDAGVGAGANAGTGNAAGNTDDSKADAGDTGNGAGTDNGAGNSDASGGATGGNTGDDNAKGAGDNNSGNAGDNNGGGGLSAFSALPVANMALLSWQDPPQGTDPPANTQGNADTQTPPTTTPPTTAPPTTPDATAPEQNQGAQKVAANLTFSHAVGFKDVMTLLNEAVGDAVTPVLYGPDYTPGSTQAHLKWTVEFPGQSWEQVNTWLTQVANTVKDRPVFPATNNIGSQVASDTRNIGLAAMIASLFFIVVYIWVRFQKVSYGFAAVIALIHDVLITLGAIAISAYLTGIPTIDAFKINLEMLAAFLTLIGYSLNDTIVIFDRIREVKGKSPRLTEDMINASVNQTLSRTILTSGTTLIVIVILYFFGGQGVHGFSFALFVGIVTGTYSSVFIASPVLLWMSRSAENGQAQKRVGGVARPEAAK